MHPRKAHGEAMNSAIEPSSSVSPLHVVVGAGQIGPMVAGRLLARGVRVRIVRRSRRAAGLPAGAELVTADVADPAQAIDAMRGASVVYHCGNPRYDKWPAELLPLNRGIAAGAAAAGARLVVLDNLYMYGVPADGVLREDTPVAPVAKKGKLRAEGAAELLAMHRAGKVAVTIARAADFFGPNCGRSLFGERFWPRLLAGKSIEYVGNPDLPRSYAYTEDVADGLVTLGLEPASSDAYGRVWHLPHPPAETTRAWVERFARLVDQEPKMMKLHAFLLHVFGLFIPEAGELPEMIYQWEQPFTVDDTAFRARFGVAATPPETAAAATAAWARRQWGAKDTQAAAAA
jgi:nucleoside-diphosphate-sugar epimerase